MRVSATFCGVVMLVPLRGVGMFLHEWYVWLIFNEIYLSFENVDTFVEPFCVNCDIEALYVAPPCLFVGVELVVVAKTKADYIVCPEGLLDDYHDGCLHLWLWEVVGNEGCVNLEFQQVANAAISGDANLKFLVIINDYILEHNIPCFFSSDNEECNFFLSKSNLVRPINSYYDVV